MDDLFNFPPRSSTITKRSCLRGLLSKNRAALSFLHVSVLHMSCIYLIHSTDRHCITFVQSESPCLSSICTSPNILWIESELAPPKSLCFFAIRWNLMQICTLCHWSIWKRRKVTSSIILVCVRILISGVIIPIFEHSDIIRRHTNRKLYFKIDTPREMRISLDQ